MSERLYIDEGATVIVEGNGVLAVLQRDAVEVWSEDGETHFGKLPADATEADVSNAMLFYNKGFDVGAKVGADGARGVIRQALGIS